MLRWPVTLVIRSPSNPAWKSTVVVVARMQWFVYIVDSPAFLLISFIIPPILLWPRGMLSYHTVSFTLAYFFGRRNRESHRGFNFQSTTQMISLDKDLAFHIFHTLLHFFFFLHTDTLVIFILFHGKFV